MSPDPAPDQPAPDPPAGTDPADRADQPVLPVQSQEDTDAAWGDHHEPDDDERLNRDRPPHWDSA